MGALRLDQRPSPMRRPQRRTDGLHAPLRVPQVSGLQRLRLHARPACPDPARGGAAGPVREHQTRAGRHPGDRVLRPGVPAHPGRAAHRSPDPPHPGGAGPSGEPRSAPPRRSGGDARGLRLPTQPGTSSAIPGGRPDPEPAHRRGGPRPHRPHAGLRGHGAFPRGPQPPPSEGGTPLRADLRRAPELTGKPSPHPLVARQYGRDRGRGGAGRAGLPPPP